MPVLAIAMVGISHHHGVNKRRVMLLVFVFLLPAVLMLVPIFAHNLIKFNSWGLSAQTGTHLAYWVLPPVKKFETGVSFEKTKAKIIVLCGVHFMAETAKLMNPSKKVLIPDMQAGCSLAESITGQDVRMLKEKYPGVPVVSYVNTSADVKAETDICCTSANAVKVVESLGTDKVIFLPDHYLANYVQKNTKVKIISWQGTCMVHEKFTGKEVEDIKKENPGIEVIAHPECPPDVISASDFAGSTSSMVKYVKEKQPKKVLLVTECTMSDNVQVENPNVQFVKPCNLCPHMKKITLNKIFDCLKNETNEIKIGHNIAEMARKSVLRMAEIGR